MRLSLGMLLVVTVLTGFTVNVMTLQSKNIKNSLRNQRMYHSTVYYTCTIQLNAKIFHFAYFDKVELNELNSIDLSSQLSSLVPYETHSKLTKLPNLSEFD